MLRNARRTDATRTTTARAHTLNRRRDRAAKMAQAVTRSGRLRLA